MALIFTHLRYVAVYSTYLWYTRFRSTVQVPDTLELSSWTGLGWHSTLHNGVHRLPGPSATGTDFVFSFCVGISSSKSRCIHHQRAGPVWQLCPPTCEKSDDPGGISKLHASESPEIYWLSLCRVDFPIFKLSGPVLVHLPFAEEVLGDEIDYTYLGNVTGNRCCL